MKKKIITMLIVCSIAIIPAMSTVSAFSLGSVLKVGAVGLLVDQFSKPLNSFINSLMAQNGVSSDYATKVVPIIVVGSGTYAGAAQVTGPNDLVEKTKAVLQLEGDFNGSTFRVKALIPIDTKNVTSFNRVQGVGVSAQIDVKI